MDRINRRVHTWLVLGAFLGSFVLAPFVNASHAAAGDIDACDVSPTGVHLRAEFNAARPPLATEHCAVCHWLRTARSIEPGTCVTVAAGVEPAGRYRADVERRPNLSIVTEHASRAPPLRLG